MNDGRIHGGTAEVLRQGLALLDALSHEQYTTKISVAFNASIGGHYRHVLDHFQSLLLAVETDSVNYDHRRRDPRIEVSRDFAESETRRILAGMESFASFDLTRPLLVQCMVSYGVSTSPTIPSTWGRELMYAVTHAIHHYALIGIICGIQGSKIPAGFGVAPSTFKHHEDEAYRLATTAA